MLPRHEMHSLIERLKIADKQDIEDINEKVADALTKDEMAAEDAFVWGGRERAMIKAADLPYAKDMVKRLKEKYKDKLSEKQLDAIQNIIVEGGNEYTTIKNIPKIIVDNTSLISLIMEDLIILLREDRNSVSNQNDEEYE